MTAILQLAHGERIHVLASIDGDTAFWANPITGIGFTSLLPKPPAHREYVADASAHLVPPQQPPVPAPVPEPGTGTALLLALAAGLVLRSVGVK